MIRGQKSYDYLMHYGIKGMKWGVRRYQNPDGTLTDKGKKRYSDDLYKSLTKNQYRHGQGSQYANNEIIESISNDRRVLEAKANLKNTKYDGPDEDYSPFTDPKVVSKANSLFEKDMGRKYNPDDRRDTKILDSYIDEVADKSGAYKRAEKINSAPNWDKAYKEYVDTKKKVIDEYIGKHADDPIKTWHGEEKYRDVVDNIIFDVLDWPT